MSGVIIPIHRVSRLQATDTVNSMVLCVSHVRCFGVSTSIPQSTSLSRDIVRCWGIEVDTPYYVTAARYIHNPMRGYPDWSKTIPCVLVLGHLWATHKRKDRQTGDSGMVETCVPKPNSIPIFFNYCSSIPIQFQFQFFQIQFHSSPVPYPTNSSPILFQLQPVPINSILQFYNSVQFYTRN